MMVTAFGIVLPWVLVVVGGWMVVQLIKQNGRILIQMEMLDQKLTQLLPRAPVKPPTLAAGSVAPDFELPDVDGVVKRMADFRGQRLLMVFFNPNCGFCMQMGDALAELSTDARAGVPRLVLICSGEPELIKTTIADFEIRGPVLIQKATEVSEAYRANSTPSGYLIDESGKIVTERVIGAEPLLKIAEPVGPADEKANGAVVAVNGVAIPHPPAAAPAESASETEEAKPCGCKKPCHCAKQGKGKVNKGVAASKLIRDGLKAGTMAPPFQLPRLDGGELALEEYRGRRVLLVFSDPQCGPCEQVAPGLQALHKERLDLQVLMVSRREPELNRTKVTQLGLTFPVVLQKQWEISRLYGMFSTPIGYMIDEQGVLVSDVAVGAGPILALASQPTAAAAPALPS
jgi:peroxiredoxin